MSTEDLVLTIEKPHFVVKLHKDLLEVDMKEGAKKKLEDVVEKNPALRGSLGVLFQTIVPLDVPLKDIDSVHVDDEGRLKIALPMRRDITIPLIEKESRELMENLNNLIPLAKEKELRRIITSRRAKIGTRMAKTEGVVEARKRYG